MEGRLRMMFRVHFLLSLALSWMTCCVYSQESTGQISEARIGSLKFQALLNDAPEGLPALPDLSYPRTVAIPGTASLDQVLPVLWNGVLIPPGLHRVEIESFRDREPQLRVIPYGGGNGVRIPAVRSILDRPASSLRWTLSSIVDGKSKKPEDALLQLDLRWGILQLTCEGRPLSTEVIQQGRWKLETHPFPSGTEVGDRQFLGIFEDPRLSPRRWRCLLEKSSNKKLQLVFVDPSRDRRAASHQQWFDRLRGLRRQLKELDAESGNGVEDQRKVLTKEISRAQTMVGALDEALRNLDDEARKRTLEPYGQVGPGRSGLEVDLKIGEQGAFLHVLCKEGRFRFLVSDSL